MMDKSTLWQGDLYSVSIDEMSLLSNLSSEELGARRAKLAEIVPKRQYGDGVETHEDFIRPQHAKDEVQQAAAKELHWVRVWLGEIERTNPKEDTDGFAKAATRARGFLLNYGIDFKGMRKTYVFWSKSRCRYIQVNYELHRQLVSKGQRQIGYHFKANFGFVSANPNEHLPNARQPSVRPEQSDQARAWVQKYPWRGSCISLGALFGTGTMEPNTPLWHAIRILKCYEVFKAGCADLKGGAKGDGLAPDEIMSGLKEASELSFTAGLSANAIEKKPLEYEVAALQQTTSKRAKAGGAKSASQRAKRVEAFMAEIEVLGVLFPKVSEKRLVDQAFENVVARDSALWRQGKGQKDTYLSGDIRSQEPYKSRYDTIFRQTA